ncbi:MAG: Obg family GTPase CgtA, partial [Solirubrobacterales bacterium]
SEEDEGAWRIDGPGIQTLINRHDLANPEALAFVEERLHQIGVVRALRRAGFDDGDEVRIGDDAFDFMPAR